MPESDATLVSERTRTDRYNFVEENALLYRLVRTNLCCNGLGIGLVPCQ